MPGEPTDARVAAVPGVWRLGWLLFMQPITLHNMQRAWGLDGDPPLIRFWRLARTATPAGRTLLGRYAFLLLVLMPAAAIAIAGVMAACGVALSSTGAIGVAGGAALGLMFSLTSGVAAGVALGVAAGIGAVVVGGAGGAAVRDMLTARVAIMTFCAILGTAFGVIDGVSYGNAGTPGFGLSARTTEGAVWCLVLGLVVGVMGGVARGSVFDVGVGVAGGLAGAVGAFRVPFWIAELLLTWWLAWRMRRRPGAIHQLASRLPCLHDELIYVPLPGLRSCLIEIGEVDPKLGRMIINRAAISVGQHRIARLALIELQARDLDRVARARLFLRAAELDFPFFFWDTDLASEPANAPFVAFQTAARDLIAGGTHQRQRHLALVRAKDTLESFRTTTAGASDRSPLARRLLRTAALWLDVIAEEIATLQRKMREHPEVPSAFIAGPPLTPDRAEDHTLFKGRRDIIKFIEHDLGPDRRGVMLVVGQRRIGKTSLCNWLPRYLGTGTTVIVCNFQPLSGDTYRDTPHRLILRNIETHLVGTSAPPRSTRWADGLHWLERLDRSRVDRKILVVIDEVERVEDGIRNGWCSADFLDFLRAAGDALRHIRFLLLSAYPLHRLGPHWTDRLVSITGRTMSYLEEGDARELLAHPVPDFPDIYPEGGIARILERTGRHPYLVQKAGDDLCRLLNSRGGVRRATLDELTEVFDGMVRDVHVFDEIWHARTADEQAALRRLARSDEPGDPDPAAIQLAREDYLVRRGDKLAIAVPLFREWIRMNVM